MRACGAGQAVQDEKLPGSGHVYDIWGRGVFLQVACRCLDHLLLSWEDHSNAREWVCVFLPSLRRLRQLCTDHSSVSAFKHGVFLKNAKLWLKYHIF